MILPALLIYALFYLYPTLSNLRYAFTEWDGLLEPRFIGFENFTRTATNDDIFRKVLGNNIEFSFLVIIFQTAFSLIFAIFLLKNTRTSIALRTLYFFPTILSSVSVALVWMFIYEPNLGALNTLLRGVGLDSLALSWLGSETITLRAIAFTQVWFHTGQMMVVYIAGLQQIPQELYEAAEVDGASRWQQFKSVTWPMALPTTAVVLAYTTIQSFRAFDLIYTMTGGGPNNSTNILVTLIYQSAFGEYRFGYAASLSVYLVVFILLLTWVQRRILRTKY
ncbi:MAG: ABC transporter permease subunit [Actinobacteria bacterium]|nr:ABC transporter permease subunit [Actinomycetota bacterium]